jgi:NAD dependent epimerase/dehydratase family enzyme
MSWIERDDLVRLIAHAVATPSLAGPVNATAPEPVRNVAFAQELGRALHRPAVLRLPAAPLRLAAGDLAEELLLGGQRVIPEKALKHGFVFRHPTVRAAFAAIFGSPASESASPAPEGNSALRHAGL